jgi:hypothetical protein
MATRKEIAEQTAKGLSKCRLLARCYEDGRIESFHFAEGHSEKNGPWCGTASQADRFTPKDARYLVRQWERVERKMDEGWSYWTIDEDDLASYRADGLLSRRVAE